jgi:DNA integrity scanning protein DisA with diadenylate cyclase activity
VLPESASRHPASRSGARMHGHVLSASVSSAGAWLPARPLDLPNSCGSTARHREAGGITKSAAATTAAVREATPILR